MVARSLSVPGGDEAVYMRVAQDYIGKLPRSPKKHVGGPSLDLTDVRGVLEKLRADSSGGLPCPVLLWIHDEDRSRGRPDSDLSWIPRAESYRLCRSNQPYRKRPRPAVRS
jgi:hypothetical protein